MSLAHPAPILPALVSGLAAAAASPSLSLAAADVPAVADLLAGQLAPALEHLANAEPWYRSRVTWGAILSASMPLLAAVGIAADWLPQDELAGFLAAAGAALGSALTLYGRWRARRALGR